MANEKNLVPQSERTKSEQREIAKKGGIKSGQVRRQKKTLSDLAKMIADTPAPDAARRKLEQIGIEAEDASNNAVIVASVYSKAVKGNMQAVEKWEQLVAETKEDTGKYELPARVLGRAFVDINRQIRPNVRGRTWRSEILFCVVENHRAD